jgi:UDP-3-O-[3-hydroxymyristoyl] glucosamine N-acyltransferase
MNGQAFISEGAIVASSVRIGPGEWIGPNVELRDNVVIGPNAVIGWSKDPSQCGKVEVGEGTTIGPSACIEPHVQIGPNCRVDYASVIGSGSRLMHNVQVGYRCTIMGNCSIGPHVVLHSEVHVSQWATLQDHCWLMPGVILLNDSYPPTGLVIAGPTVGSCAIVGAGAILWPGVKLGYHSMVSVLSEAKVDVPDYTLVRGRPATPVCDVRKIRMQVKGKCALRRSLGSLSPPGFPGVGATVPTAAARMRKKPPCSHRSGRREPETIRPRSDP